MNLLSFKIDSQEEYETALRLENISYLQISGRTKMPFIENYSPSVYYRHNIQEGEYPELEYYVEHATDDTYWWYNKENEKWIKIEAPSPGMFKIPTDFAREHNLIATLNDFPYDTLTYKNGHYFIEKSGNDITEKITLQFLDKKLISFDGVGEAHKYFNFTYDEITPELPTPDSTTK